MGVIRLDLEGHVPGVDTFIQDNLVPGYLQFTLWAVHELRHFFQSFNWQIPRRLGAYCSNIELCVHRRVDQYL